MVLKEGENVLDKEGNPVPWYPTQSNRGNGAINSYWLSYAEYNQLDEVFCQRDTEGRLNKARKHLSNLRAEHCVVTVLKLTKKDSVFGVTYKAGHRFIGDSNTRNLNWGQGGSDKIPQEVLVIEYSYDSCDGIRESYNTFDSADSVEKTQEKIFGILYGIYGYTPQSKKLKGGTILTGLNKACCFYFPQAYTQVNVKADILPGLIGSFLEEIKALDLLMEDSTSWDQALICAALMALKRYGTDNKKLITGLEAIDKRGADTRGKDWDGITHIVDEYKTHKFIPVKTTSWAILEPNISYCLYWIDKYMNDSLGSKPGRNWQNRGFEYKDQPQASDFIQQLTSNVTGGFAEAGDLTLVKDKVA